jgi:hypothetical protein
MMQASQSTVSSAEHISSQMDAAVSPSSDSGINVGNKGPHKKAKASKAATPSTSTSPSTPSVGPPPPTCYSPRCVCNIRAVMATRHSCQLQCSPLRLHPCLRLGDYQQQPPPPHHPPSTGVVS